MREPMPDCAPVGNSPTMAAVSAMATATLSDANRNGTAGGKAQLPQNLTPARVVSPHQIKLHRVRRGEPLHHADGDGEEAENMEMSDLGMSPVRPIDPSTTITMGAMARMGIACDAMIHGIRLLLSNLECTMATASPIPSTVPSTKPSSVDESVTHT